MGVAPQPIEHQLPEQGAEASQRTPRNRLPPAWRRLEPFIDRAKQQRNFEKRLQFRWTGKRQSGRLKSSGRNQYRPTATTGNPEFRRCTSLSSFIGLILPPQFQAATDRQKEFQREAKQTEIDADAAAVCKVDVNPQAVMKVEIAKESIKQPAAASATSKVGPRKNSVGNRKYSRQGSSKFNKEGKAPPKVSLLQSVSAAQKKYKEALKSATLLEDIVRVAIPPEYYNRVECREKLEQIRNSFRYELPVTCKDDDMHVLVYDGITKELSPVAKDYIKGGAGFSRPWHAGGALLLINQWYILEKRAGLKKKLSDSIARAVDSTLETTGQRVERGHEHTCASPYFEENERELMHKEIRDPWYTFRPEAPYIVSTNRTVASREFAYQGVVYKWPSIYKAGPINDLPQLRRQPRRKKSLQDMLPSIHNPGALLHESEVQELSEDDTYEETKNTDDKEAERIPCATYLMYYPELEVGSQQFKQLTKDILSGMDKAGHADKMRPGGLNPPFKRVGRHPYKLRVRMKPGVTINYAKIAASLRPTKLDSAVLVQAAPQDIRLQPQVLTRPDDSYECDEPISGPELGTIRTVLSLAVSIDIIATLHHGHPRS